MASDRIRRNPQAKTVIVDTSAILMLFEFSIDLEAELTRLLGKHQIVIPSAVINELHQLNNRGNSATSRHAHAAIQLLKRYPVIPTNETGDDALVALAKQLKCPVVTNDMQLRRRLKNIPVSVVYLRGKKTLTLD